MNAVAVIAGRELRESLRNRWVLAATGLLAILALVLAFLGSVPAGGVEAGSLAVTVVSLASLSIYLLPLIALLVSYDAIAGEQERGTLALLLAYPVARWQVLLGKFVGHALVLAFATVVGFGIAAGALAATAEVAAPGLRAFGLLLVSSVLLGWVFVAAGYLISVLVRQSATAAGLAIAVWLVVVVLYDMALLGALVATGGQGGFGDAVPWLLLLNPADAYRLANLAGSEGVAAVSGLEAVAAGLGPAPALLALGTWIVLLLALAWRVFQRREW